MMASIMVQCITRHQEIHVQWLLLTGCELLKGSLGNSGVKPLKAKIMLEWVTFLTLDFLMHPTTTGHPIIWGVIWFNKPCGNVGALKERHVNSNLSQSILYKGIFKRVVNSPFREDVLQGPSNAHDIPFKLAYEVDMCYFDTFFSLHSLPVEYETCN